MIVRKSNSAFLLISQHDHGGISGRFAQKWRGEISPREPTLYAIANHDVGWLGLDEELSWNPQTGEPYSFLDYPLEPKLGAYSEGIDVVESHSAYAGCLCSMHYASFVQRATEAFAIQFREGERRRQKRLRRGMEEEEAVNLEHNFRLLQLCDDLSLFVCLNEPGRNEFPWFVEGFSFEGQKIAPVWEDERTLRFEPGFFTEAFEISIPYRSVDRAGEELGSGATPLRIL